MMEVRGVFSSWTKLAVKSSCRRAASSSSWMFFSMASAMWLKLTASSLISSLPVTLARGV